MRPILLKGHERSITCVKYNYDGDFLFTCSKDTVPTMWRASDGMRFGTFNGHQGAVWDIDINKFSTRVLTASADQTARLWDCETGDEIMTFNHKGPVRGVAWGDGDQLFATVSDPFLDNNALICVYDCPEGESRSSYSAEPRLIIDISKDLDVKATNVAWLNLNSAVLVTFDDGSIRTYNPINGKMLKEITTLHKKKINRITFNKQKTIFITASNDASAKLVDAVTLEELKAYTTDRPVNDAVISPDKEHILLGGGQDAMSVTTTGDKSGKFETRFFHLVYQEEFGTVKGHFGPINALAVNPDGKSYASGAEDGYIRLHFYDRDYLEMKDPVSEAKQEEATEVKQ